MKNLGKNCKTEPLQSETHRINETVMVIGYGYCRVEKASKYLGMCNG